MSNAQTQDAFSAAQALVIIEPGIVSQLASKGISEQELAGLDAVNNRLEAMARAGDLADWAVLDRYFHIKLTNNLPFAEVKLLACSLINRINRLTINNRDTDDLLVSVDEHRAIIDCIRRRDSVSAAELLRMHRNRILIEHEMRSSGGAG